MTGGLLTRASVTREPAFPEFTHRNARIGRTADCPAPAAVLVESAFMSPMSPHESCSSPPRSAPDAIRRFARPLIVAGALAIAGLSSACAPGSIDGPDAGTIVRQLCSTNEECSGGFVCDQIRRTCVCTSDSVCAGMNGSSDTPSDTPYCNAFTGKCVAEVAGCTADDQCRSDEYCNEGLRSCRPRRAWCEPCTVDAECGGPGDRCVVHPEHPNAPRFCGTACQNEGDCPDEQECVETDRGRQCVPPSGRCSTHQTACTPDSRQPCATDDDCTAGAGQVCDRQLRECVVASATCPAGQVCDPLSLRCDQPCRSDTECRVRHDDPELVCVNRLCSRPDTCETHDDCDDNRWCYHEPGKSTGLPGVCRPNCVASTDCPLGETCQEDSTSNRKRCLPGCTPGAHSGCPLNAICGDDGQCKFENTEGKRHCQSRQACQFGERCIDNVCVMDSAQCRPTGSQGCAPGERSFTTWFNRSCGGTTCPAGYQTAQFAWAGCSPEPVFACEISICIPRNCTGAWDSCPQGYECHAFDTGNHCVPADPGQCIPQ